MAQLSSDQARAVANGFTDAVDAVRGILMNNNIPLSRGEAAALSSDLTSLTNFSANLAVVAAKLAFQDADDAFTRITNATTQANADAKSISANAAKITAVVNVFASVVRLGMAFTSGPLAVLQAAGDVETAVQASQQADS